MEVNSASRRSISLVRYEDDQALVERGSLIPLGVTKRAPGVLLVRPSRSLLVTKSLIAAFLLLVVGAASVFGASNYSFAEIPDSLGLVATPAVMFKNPYSEREIVPDYGPKVAYSDEAFYADARDRLISGAATFIDLDLVTMNIRYFKRGVLEISGPVAHKAGVDSWCKVAAGLYQVKDTVKDHYSSYVDGRFPNSIIFSSNLFIHGWPTHSDGVAVSDDFARDCVRLEDSVAGKLFTEVKDGTPVLVHEVAEERETLSFESKVPRFSTPHYLIADLKSETIVAVSKRYDPVPVASLTKLMTALIVLEELSLDDRLTVHEPNMIETLVPRLRDLSRVSVHTLLELLLVESSNEAAEVLASGMGRAKFIKRMNARASEIGLVDTTFTDPSGLDSGNVSSVNDLWWLTRYLYLHQPFIFTLTRDEAVLPKYVNDSYADLINFNTVESVDSFIGGKVGETLAAGQTSITLHRIMIGDDERDVAIILLGSEGRRKDVIELLGYLTERFPR